MEWDKVIIRLDREDLQVLSVCGWSCGWPLKHRKRRMRRRSVPGGGGDIIANHLDFPRVFHFYLSLNYWTAPLFFFFFFFCFFSVFNPLEAVPASFFTSLLYLFRTEVYLVTETLALIRRKKMATFRPCPSKRIFERRIRSNCETGRKQKKRTRTRRRRQREEEEGGPGRVPVARRIRIPAVADWLAADNYRSHLRAKQCAALFKESINGWSDSTIWPDTSNDTEIFVSTSEFSQWSIRLLHSAHKMTMNFRFRPTSAEG